MDSPHPNHEPRLKVSNNLKEKESALKVAIIVHEGIEVLDFTGPGEVFAATTLGEKAPFEVFTVNKTTAPILSQGFLKVLPTYDIEHCPQPDILVIPGGGTKLILQDEAMMAWIDKTARAAAYVLTVCTGALALAKTGLLDGKQATTWHGMIEDFRRMAPKVTILENTRWVDNGAFITTAGVSAGIDGALHLVARIHGLATAQATARYMEYDKWDPEAGKVCAA